MPTPTVAHLRNHDEPIENYEARVQQWRDGELRGKPGVSLGVEVRRSLLPTPTTQESSGKCRDHGGDLLHEVTCACDRSERRALLRTPIVDDSKNDGNNQKRYETLARQVLTTEWGKYEPAIRQWEQVINTPAPPATVADGREGNHRLNPEFAEWLMGIPGRLDGLDLSRAERLKMAGNGVCPQQAELALTILLERVNNEQMAR